MYQGIVFPLSAVVPNWSAMLILRLQALSLFPKRLIGVHCFISCGLFTRTSNIPWTYLTSLEADVKIFIRISNTFLLGSLLDRDWVLNFGEVKIAFVSFTVLYQGHFSVSVYIYNVS
jgi:hypothetical protein